jgi:organic hydroperoxide reductase OsmC/OhrA
MTQPSKMLYTAKTHTTGGRENGVTRSSEAQLEIRLSPPASGHPGTNPEQLFAAGWSACSDGAINHAVRLKKIAPPSSRLADHLHQ